MPRPKITVCRCAQRHVLDSATLVGRHRRHETGCGGRRFPDTASWPFPATSTMSPRRCASNRTPDRRRPIQFDFHRNETANPHDISAAISSGASERGLSLVTHTRSAPAFDCPRHQRALAAITITAAAKYADQHGRRHDARSPASTFDERIRRMREVDHDRRFARAHARIACAPAAPLAVDRTSITSSIDAPARHAAAVAAAKFATLNSPNNGTLKCAPSPWRCQRSARCPRRRTPDRTNSVPRPACCRIAAGSMRSAASR